MPTNDGNMMACDKRQAEMYGFNIEGPVCFIWDLPVGAICLGPTNECWQADTSVDDSGSACQMTGKLHDLIEICSAVSKIMTLKSEVCKLNLHDVCMICGFEVI